MFMYKLNKKKLPEIFDKKFIKFSDIHDHDTRYAASYQFPHYDTNRRQHTINFYGPQVWNIIMREIDVNCKIGTFKKRLRSLLLSKHSTLFKDCV